MSSLKFLTGDPARYNLFAWGVRTSTNEDTKFPLSNVADHDPGKPFKFNDAGASRQISVDAVMTTNGPFTTWSGGAPTGWTKTITGTGSVTEDTGVFASTPASARLSQGASGTAKLTQQITVRAGQKMQLELKIRTDAASPPLVGRLFVQNLRTQKWLHPTDGWTASQAAYISGGVNGSFQIYGSGIGSPNGQFQVESFLAVEADTCLLELTLDCTGGTGNVWFDDVYIFPGCDFASVHGHNVEPALPVVAKYSFDGTNFVTAATMTPRRPSFYGIFAETFYGRHYRLEYSGTPSTASGPVWYGEVVFGQLETALRAHLYGWPTRYIFDQLRNANEVGHVQAFRRALLERRALKLEFQLGELAQFEQVRDQWARRSFGGLYPMVVIPDDSDASLVIQGRMLDEWEATKHFLQVWGTDIVIAESGFPTVTT